MNNDLLPDAGALAAASERLLNTIAGAPLPWPLYVVAISQLPAEWHNAWFVGLAGRRLDMHCRRALGKRWRGRGPTVLVNDLALGDNPEPVRSAFFHAIAIHEFAHVVDLGWDYPEDAPMPTASETAAVREHRENSQAETMDAIEFSHGPSWIRLAITLAERARRSMPSISLARCLQNSLPAYCAWEWRATMLDELHATRDLSIFDLAKLPIPKALDEIWQDAILLMRAESSNPEALT